MSLMLFFTVVFEREFFDSFGVAHEDDGADAGADSGENHVKHGVVNARFEEFLHIGTE